MEHGRVSLETRVALSKQLSGPAPLPACGATGRLSYIATRVGVFSMFWVFGALAVCSAIVIAGRAHSRRLDELDDLHSRGFLNDQKIRFLRGLSASSSDKQPLQY
jgi:hypothetical protein